MHREQEIRDLIEQRFQVAYGRSTVYATLSRGIKSGKYEQTTGGKWHIKSGVESTDASSVSLGQENKDSVEDRGVEAVNP